MPDTAYNQPGKINTSDQFIGLGTKTFDEEIGLQSTSGYQTRIGGDIYGGFALNWNVSTGTTPTAANANAVLYAGDYIANGGHGGQGDF